MDITVQAVNVIKERVDSIINDEELRSEIASQLKRGSRSLSLESAGLSDKEMVRRYLENPQDQENQPSMTELETIVLRRGRPVFLVRNNTIAFDSTITPPGDVWPSRLRAVLSNIESAIRSVGRIDVENHLTYDWIGTGWLVREDVIVTNRHVAEEFAERNGNGFRFKKNFLGRTMEGFIDYREEHQIDAELEFKLAEVLHVEESSGPDMALFRVERSDGHISEARPIRLATTPIQTGRRVAVIGYPAADTRILDQSLMRQVFGDIYNVKRLAPGEITNVAPEGIEHDCSTLGGNSGSPIIDLVTGHAIGLHFSGSYLRANYAVTAQAISDRLENL